MPNEKNLLPHRFTSEQSREEASKNGRLGGIESGKARRRKRSLKDAADLFLSLPVSDRRSWNKLARAGVDPEDIDNQMAIIVSLSLNAAKGDTRAAKLLFELLGEDAKDAEKGNTLSDFLKATAPTPEMTEKLYDDEE